MLVFEHKSAFQLRLLLTADRVCSLTESGHRLIETFRLNQSGHRLIDSFRLNQSGHRLMDTFSLTQSGHRLIDTFRLNQSGHILIDTFRMNQSGHKWIDTFRLNQSGHRLIDTFRLNQSGHRLIENNGGCHQAATYTTVIDVRHAPAQSGLHMRCSASRKMRIGGITNITDIAADTRKRWHWPVRVDRSVRLLYKV